MTSNALGFGEGSELDFLEAIMDEPCPHHPTERMWPDCIKCDPCDWHPDLPMIDCPECMAYGEGILDAQEDEWRHRD